METPLTSAPVERDARGGARVSVRGLSKIFEHGGRVIEVLRGLSFDLAPGEIASVVGASGVGKSTLLHVLGTLDAPTAGTITFDGVDVTRDGPHAIGGVPQPRDRLRLPVPSPAARVHRARERDDAGADPAAAPPRVRRPRDGDADAAWAWPSGSPTGRASCRAASSSGWRWPARCCCRPRLLLADEPTGNLDTKTGREIHELFFELNRELGMTILIVTHNDELAAKTPRRLRMADGAIVERD